MSAFSSKADIQADEVTVFANPDFDPDKNLFYSNYYVLPDGTLMASAPGSAPDTVR